ncbi:MAG TPA: alpha/beta fold hydrolase, partial [Steroidobacteraceae bacterium]
MKLSAIQVFAALLAMQPAWSAIERVDHRVQGDRGIALAVREVRDEVPSGKVPVILIHGARVPGIASFDLPVEGGSLAQDLALAGHRVFIMDARGYGDSTRLGQTGPQEGSPLVRSDEVVRDIAAVVRDVRGRTGRNAVALLGWATGGHWAGMFASLHPKEVSHLIIYNSLYGAHRGHPTLGPGSDLSDPANPDQFDAARFGAWRLNTAE